MSDEGTYQDGWDDAERSLLDILQRKLDLLRRRATWAEARAEEMAVVLDLPELLEELSAIEHERWSKWMRYLFTKGSHLYSGAFAISEDSVKRWMRQMETAYVDLTEKEKESDRHQVRPVLDTIRAALARYDAGSDGGEEE